MTHLPTDAPGWRPDPAGRFPLRWWDGSRWTDSVSAEGQVHVDPAGAGPTPPDTEILDAPALAVDQSPTGGQGAGSWAVWDAGSMANLGWIAVDLGGLFGLATYRVLDRHGRPVLFITRTSRIGPFRVDVGDHLGRLVGRVQAQGSLASLLAPAPGTGAEVAWASAHLPGLRWGLGAPRETTNVAPLVGGDGSTFGHLAVPWVSGSARRPVTSQWFHLQRPDGLGEPLRSLTVALIPFAALLRTEMLAVQSRSHRRSQFRH